MKLQSVQSYEILSAALGERPSWKCRNVHNWFGRPPGTGTCKTSNAVAGYLACGEGFEKASEDHQRTFLILIARVLA